MSLTFVAAMLSVVWLFLVFPLLVTSYGEGNIHLLTDEVAEALRGCSQLDKALQKNDNLKRQRRFVENTHNDLSPRIDANSRQETNQYDHERRNLNYSDQMNVINGSDLNRFDTFSGNRSNLRLLRNNYNSNVSLTRIKRNKPLVNRESSDQCLSQCVFANLQVVDIHGIPREAELWKIIQSSVSSQQSRALLKDQMRSCFQELQSESEDNGCSYSNKLERCMMFRFSDRRIIENES